MNTGVQSVSEVAPEMFRGEPTAVADWIERRETRILVGWLTMIVAVSGLFGAAIGGWHSPQQAFYAAVKLPLLILLTVFANAFLNGMLAPLIGMKLGIRSSLMAVLLSFALASAILAGFVPVLAFIAWNVPRLEVLNGTEILAYRFMQPATVGMIAAAGVIANVKPLRYFEHESGSRRVSRAVLFSWLAGNLLLGSQICWVLRPFIGWSTAGAVFLMDDPMQGNFSETCQDAFRALATGNAEMGQ